MAYGFPRAGTACPSPRGSCRASSSPLQLFGRRFADSDRCRHQSRQQRRPGRGRRQNDRPGLQPPGSANNIGYIIPCEEIDLFLQDIADGHYDGKPAMFDDLQTMENPALRPFLKIDSTVHGMIVHQPARTAPSYPLKQWDVITRIADTPIDDEGMVGIRDGSARELRLSRPEDRTRRHRAAHHRAQRQEPADPHARAAAAAAADRHAARQLPLVLHPRSAGVRTRNARGAAAGARPRPGGARQPAVRTARRAARRRTARSW